MSKYLIKALDKKIAIDDINLDDGYEIEIKSRKYSSLKMITIYDNKVTNYLIIDKLRKEINKIIALINNNDGDSDSIILDEIIRLRQIAEYKYQKFLKKDEYQKFLNSLFTLENIVNDKEDEMEITR